MVNQSYHVIEIDYNQPLVEMSYCQEHDDWFLGRCLICAYEYRHRYYKRPPRIRDKEKAKEHLRIRWKFRAFKKRLAAGSFTYEEWQKKLEEYNNCCAYCGKLLIIDITIDHDIPIAKGGTNSIDNLVPCCKPCNSKKHSKTGDEFKALMK